MEGLSKNLIGSQNLVVTLLLIGCILLPSTLTEGQVLTPHEAKLVLKKHNEYRRQEPASDMYLMHWNISLQQRADNWASRCIFKHERNLDVGENLFFDTDKENDVLLRGMKLWHDEKSIFGYSDRSCTGACHYTQLVWAYTTTVGCSSHICPSLNVAGQTIRDAIFFVCYYYPRGNFAGYFPFSRGRSCSECAEGDTCSDGLCVSSGPESKLAPDLIRSLQPLKRVTYSQRITSLDSFKGLLQKFGPQSSPVAQPLQQQTHSQVHHQRQQHVERTSHSRHETVVVSSSSHRIHHNVKENHQQRRQHQYNSQARYRDQQKEKERQWLQEMEKERQRKEEERRRKEEEETRMRLEKQNQEESERQRLMEEQRKQEERERILQKKIEEQEKILRQEEERRQLFEEQEQQRRQRQEEQERQREKEEEEMRRQRNLAQKREKQAEEERKRAEHMESKHRHQRPHISHHQQRHHQTLSTGGNRGIVLNTDVPTHGHSTNYERVSLNQYGNGNGVTQSSHDISRNNPVSPRADQIAITTGRVNTWRESMHQRNRHRYHSHRPRGRDEDISTSSSILSHRSPTTARRNNQQNEVLYQGHTRPRMATTTQSSTIATVVKILSRAEIEEQKRLNGYNRGYETASRPYSYGKIHRSGSSVQNQRKTYKAPSVYNINTSLDDRGKDVTVGSVSRDRHITGAGPLNGHSGSSNRTGTIGNEISSSSERGKKRNQILSERTRQKMMRRKYRNRRVEVNPQGQKYVMEADGSVCSDRHRECDRWAIKCQKSAAVTLSCPLTCGKCGLHLTKPQGDQAISRSSYHRYYRQKNRNGYHGGYKTLKRSRKSKRIRTSSERQRRRLQRRQRRLHQQHSAPSELRAATESRRRLSREERRKLRARRKENIIRTRERRREERRRRKQSPHNLCRDDPKHIKSCKYWAKRGFCENNKLIQTIFCSFSCGSC